MQLLPDVCKVENSLGTKHVPSKRGTQTREAFFHAFLPSHYCLLHCSVIPPPGAGFRQALKVARNYTIVWEKQNPNGCHPEVLAPQP